MANLEMSQIDEIYDRMNDDTEIINRFVDLGKSEVQKFYAGKTLFITGVTGFLGKFLMEKLLRGCPDLKHIYVMLREKENGTPEERMKKYFDNVIFDVLRKSNPQFEKKVTVFKGELSADKLGLSDKDREIIKKEVDIIIHNAANVKFNARVNVQLKANILGTLKILDLAEECEHLELFLYVSSAYSHSYRLKIEEEFYDPPGDLSMIYDMIDADSKTENGLSDEALKMLLGDYWNCYVFTKAMAEEMVRQRAEKVTFPCAIYRPSIVVNTYKEPLIGWIGNANGPVWFFLAAGLGLFHVGVYHYRPMDLVPCDMAINALIVIMTDVSKRCASEKKAVVYNYGTSVTNPHDCWTLYSYLKDEKERGRSEQAVWLNALYITQSWTLFYFLHFFVHFIPACLADLALLLMFKKPRAMPIFLRVTRNVHTLIFLVDTDWRIHMPNTLKVIERLNPADQILFFSDPRKIIWDEWLYSTWMGLRLYILKEDLNSKAGERRYVLLWWAHHGLIAVFSLIAIYYFFNLVLSYLY